MFCPHGSQTANRTTDETFYESRKHPGIPSTMLVFPFMH